MIHNGSQIPLSEKFKAGFLGQNHAEHGVCLFNTTFLSTSHGIAEIDARTDNAISPCF